MTNSYSKLMNEPPKKENHLIFLTRVLYNILPNRDIVHKVLEDVNEIETKEHRLYFKTIHSLRDANKNSYSTSYLPYDIQASIHLFREGYIGTLSSTSLKLCEKKEIANFVSYNRRWEFGRARNLRIKSDLENIKRSIEWLETYKQEHPDYTHGGLTITVKRNMTTRTYGCSIRFSHKGYQAKLNCCISERRYKGKDPFKERQPKHRQWSALTKTWDDKKYPFMDDSLLPWFNSKKSNNELWQYPQLIDCRDKSLVCENINSLIQRRPGTCGDIFITPNPNQSIFNVRNDIYIMRTDLKDNKGYYV